MSCDHTDGVLKPVLSYRRKLAEAIDYALVINDALRLPATHTNVILAVLTAGGVVDPEQERSYWEGVIRDAADRAGVDVAGTVGNASLHLIVEQVERLEAKVVVLEAWQRGQIAAAVRCQKEGTECPVCLDQAARSMSCPECGTMVVRCTEAGVEALDRLATDRAAALRSTGEQT